MLEENLLELFGIGNIFSWTVEAMSYYNMYYTDFDDEDRKENVT